MTGVKQDVEACAFNVLGTLFDFAAVTHCKDDLCDKEKPHSDLWTAQQLEYSRLRTLMHEYVLERTNMCLLANDPAHT